MIVILASTSTGLVGVVGRRITSPEILGFGGVFGRITTSPEILGVGEVTILRENISLPFQVHRTELFGFNPLFCIQLEDAQSFVMLAVTIASLSFIYISNRHIVLVVGVVGRIITSPEILGFDGVTPQGFLLIVAGATGFFAGTLYIRERKILDTSASCIPGFANISTLPTLMTPSTHESIMVDFCIFIKKKTRYKKEKHE